MTVVTHVADALRLAGVMFWQVLWPLALGFLLSALVEVLAPAATVGRLLGRDTPRAVVTATALGAASSSCSYAAVAIARTLVRKGATLGNAIVFEFASTNLVFELGIALLVLLGWQFLGAELAGGIVMVVLLAVLMRLTLRPSVAAAARTQAARGVPGRMEGHAAMDMSVSRGRPLLRRAFSAEAVTAVAHTFVMNVYGLWFDLLLGFLIAGALGAWVPQQVWTAVFLTGHGPLTAVWDALLAPLVALISFVCSVGNVPLAAVLWRGGIGFGGVISFIFADLIILPILDIYRRYYGRAAALYLLGVSYVTMVAAGLSVGALFTAVHAVPATHAVGAITADTVRWDATTVVNIIMLCIASALTVRFVRTGGVPMLRMMEAPAESHEHAHHA